MANTLTNLTTTLYNALDVVNRELVGLIPSVASDMQYTRAAKGQTVMSHVAPASTASDIAPGVTPPNDGDQTIGNVTMTISKSRRVPVRWNGEEKLALDNNGASYNKILSDQFAQAMRALCNEVESDLAALYVGSSRATGTAGTTPFTSDLTATAAAGKILKDNGAPQTDWQLVMDTTAGVKFRTLTQLTKANEAGTTDVLRKGVLMSVHGFDIRESAQIKTPTKGTGTAYTSSAAGFAVGTTSIPVITGSGTILAGDVVTFAGDTNQYIVATGVAAPGTIVLAAPGLRQAIPASATALTISNTSTRNLAFSKNALVLATRLPALPEQGDMADDRMIVTDPVSGLSFDVGVYTQYRQVQFEIALAWGAAVAKADHLVTILG